ncbi:MAG TPA: hypothetical protein VIL52_04630 [Bacteroidota bacterium]
MFDLPNKQKGHDPPSAGGLVVPLQKHITPPGPNGEGSVEMDEGERTTNSYRAW